ncbi:hypothetical protein GJQ57_05260 [Ralstonia pickettii]|uniref:Uncharacterized protein n=1 Tax=Ralstonia pickettii TaxID=329 RepID=A0A7X2HK87_RALPI|nr:hypothetical protein [Ralstonia pickettii]MRS98063.1 hypothetical protein [Ralstonia pickettii]
MQQNIVRGKAFTLRWNNGWAEHFKGVVTLQFVSGNNKERIEMYQCEQIRSERDLAQADADRLFSLKTNGFASKQA